MILSMTMPDNVQIFTKTPSLSKDGSRIVLRSCPHLQAAIESRWRDIVAAHPELTIPEDGVKILVQDLFSELSANPNDRYIKAFWGSLLSSMAIKVTYRLARTTNLYFDDIQFACMASICNIHEFFKFEMNRDRILLPHLKAYAYQKIKCCSYSYLNFQLSTDTSFCLQA
jgi:hypothetical protein